MKVAGNGQGKILTPEELRQLFTDGLRAERDRALFGICLFTGCRVSEALALQTTDIEGETLAFRKLITKNKLKTRVVDIQPGLAALVGRISTQAWYIVSRNAGDFVNIDSVYS
jgi:integrase/recombinase XerD